MSELRRVRSRTPGGSLVTAWFRWLVGLEFEPQERCWAMRELQQRAAHDPELKPAKVLFKRAHPKKVVIGEFQARLLRMRRRA